MRTTLADLKASRIPEALNISSTDTRFTQYLNEATRRLLHLGHWHGTTGRFRMSVTSQFITLPPQIAAIEQVAVSNVVIPLHDQWFEFAEGSWGAREETVSPGVNEALYRGHYPSISDVVGVDKKLRWICDLASDVGKEVLIMGWDENNNWIRTTQDGVVADGEVVLLAQTPGTLSTLNFSAITDIILPPDLDGQVWLYEEQDVTSTQRLIGQYQYFETRPHYPRYLLPTVDTATTTVDLIGKLAFIPLAKDNDYCIIGNIDALKLGCMAVKAEEEHNWTEANLLWFGGRMPDGSPRTGAVQLLDAELNHHRGSGNRMSMQIIGSTADPVPTLL